MPTPALGPNLAFSQEKNPVQKDRVFLWRRRRDLNPRAGFPTYSLSRGAPSPLGYFSMVKYEKRYQPLVAELAGGGEEEIRTLGPLRDH